MRYRRLLYALLATMLLSAGVAEAKAATFKVAVGASQRPSVASADFDQFFPSTITVHVGDTIRWTFYGFHTVSFLAPGQPRPPLAVLDPTHPVTGKRDANGKLFWFNGQPSLDVNPQVAFRTQGSTEDGTQYRNSGIPIGRGAQTYSLTFTKVGTFHYTCLIHPGMTGTVKVVPASQHIPSQAADNATAKAQFRADERTAEMLTHVTPPRNTVIVGPSKGTVFLMAMAPAVLHVHVGDTVVFKLPRGTSETHTTSFGPAGYLSRLEKNLITPVPNPSGPPTLQFNPVAFYPSDPPPGLPPYNGRNHGNGFENSGAMDSNSHTPFPSEVRIKFTKAGTFHYECVIHAHMDGTIVVSARAARRSKSRRTSPTVRFTG